MLWSLACLLIATSALAQDKPDFSGSWVLDDIGAAPDVPRLITVTQSLGPATTVRGEPLPRYYDGIAISRTSFVQTPGGNPELTRHEGYNIGIASGSVGGQAIGDPNAETMKTSQLVAWEGRNLVIEREHYTGITSGTGDWGSHREVWVLQADGRLRMTILTEGAAQSKRVLELLYRRQ